MLFRSDIPRERPNKRTPTIATSRIMIGGRVEAIEINQAEVASKPTAATSEKPLRRAAIVNCFQYLFIVLAPYRLVFGNRLLVLPGE